MANSDPRQEGYDAAVAGADRRSPYDGRTQAGKDWYAGYDSRADELEAADMKLSDTPFEASTTDQPDDEQAPLPDESEKPAEGSDEPTNDEEDDSELAPAGASTDPDVQHAIANLQAHRMVAADPEAGTDAKRQARAAIERGVAALRRMGYRA